MINHFPKGYDPRDGQVEAINAVEAAIRAGKRYVVVEAPVGLGKSQVAMTIGSYFGDSYVIMPKVSLQAQYQESFDGDVRLVQGRARLPCTYEKHELNRKVIEIIEQGRKLAQPAEHVSCATAPCMNVRPPTREKIIAQCAKGGKCPYSAMIDEACKHNIVVANNHSFLFGAQNGNLPKRKVLIVDEAHGLERMLRGFLTIQFTVYRNIKESELAGLKTPREFSDFLSRDEQYITIPQTGRESYLARLEKFEKAGDGVYGKQAIIKVTQERNKTVFEFTPAYVGNAAHAFFFDFADTVVFMSGTIYGLDQFVNPLGIKSSDCAYTRLASDFPVENRPIVRPRNKNLDLSHKHFDANYDECVKTIENLMKHHSNQKGLIHAPNYKIAVQLAKSLGGSGRVMTHDSDTLQSQLQAFYASEKPLVFISPSVREGVDFHGDRARWQVVLRPPYPPANEPYYKWLIAQNRWDVYTRDSLLDAGQIFGRIVRSKEDWGVTYLLSSTFDSFLNKTWHSMPEWLKKGFVK